MRTCVHKYACMHVGTYTHTPACVHHAQHVYPCPAPSPTFFWGLAPLQFWMFFVILSLSVLTHPIRKACLPPQKMVHGNPSFLSLHRLLFSETSHTSALAPSSRSLRLLESLWTQKSSKNKNRTDCGETQPLRAQLANTAEAAAVPGTTSCLVGSWFAGRKEKHPLIGCDHKGQPH